MMQKQQFKRVFWLI